MFASNYIVLLFSQELIEEFVEVVQLPKFKKYFSVADLQELLTKVRLKAQCILVISTIDLYRNPKITFYCR